MCIAAMALALWSCTPTGDPAPTASSSNEFGFEYDRSGFDPRPHDHRSLGLYRLQGTVSPAHERFQGKPALCTEQTFSLDHAYHIANELHTAWHRFEEVSARVIDSVTVEITEYDVEIMCNPRESGGMICITEATLGVAMTTEGGGDPAFEDKGWSAYFHASGPASCGAADHRVDQAAVTATEQTIVELYKSVERTDREYLGIDE